MFTNSQNIRFPAKGLKGTGPPLCLPRNRSKGKGPPYFFTELLSCLNSFGQNRKRVGTNKKNKKPTGFPDYMFTKFKKNEICGKRSKR